MLFWLGAGGQRVTQNKSVQLEIELTNENGNMHISKHFVLSAKSSSEETMLDSIMVISQWGIYFIADTLQ